MGHWGQARDRKGGGSRVGCGVGPAGCPAGGGLEAAVCMGQRPEEVDDAGCVRVLAAASGEIWIWLLVCLCGLCAKGG